MFALKNSKLLKKELVRSFSTSSSSSKVYLVDGRRTPFGKFDGSLKDISPVDLAVMATKAALNETKVNPEHIDHVILGSVIPSTTDTLYVSTQFF